MSLFRVNPDTPFEGPHQSGAAVTAGPPPEEARAAVILIHGRGATARGMLQLADHFTPDDIHYHAVQANSHTWYPQSFLRPQEDNQPGIKSGMQAIYDAIASLNAAGLPTTRIVLMGFSQGACLSSEYLARHPQRYGGAVLFSGGLIGSEIDPERYEGSLEGTPVFMGCSSRDAHIPRERVEVTATVLKALGGDVTLSLYPDMGHTVNQDEISEANTLLKSITPA